MFNKMPKHDRTLYLNSFIYLISLIVTNLLASNPRKEGRSSMDRSFNGKGKII